MTCKLGVLLHPQEAGECSDYMDKWSPSCKRLERGFGGGRCHKLRGQRKKTDDLSISRGTRLWKQEGPAQSEQADRGRKGLGPDTGAQAWKHWREERNQ